MSEGYQLHTSRLRGPQQPVNTYTWQAGGQTIVIDPAGDFTQADTTDIFITHVQEENLAGCFNFPDARLHLPEGGAYLAAGPEAYDKLITNWEEPWEWETRGNYKGHLAGARNERPSRRAIARFEHLKPGPHAMGIEVIPTPGHGKHAVTILATIGGKRVAFCGDLIYGDGRMWNWFDCEWDYGLQDGQRSLQQSVRRLMEMKIDMLCPTHGPVIADARRALESLDRRLSKIFTPCTGATLKGSAPAEPNSVGQEPDPPKQASPPGHATTAPGWFRLLPNLYQWRTHFGNAAVLISKTGNALMIDDGLCSWTPLDERARHHREVIATIKREFGIKKIESLIITHYHGDHIENIPELVEMEGTEVICLDTVANVVEHPEQFNVCAPLPWYGTRYDTVKIDRRVSDGTRIQWREFDNIEIFHVGGQTYYHAAILIGIGGVRTIFIGDAIGLGPDCEPVMCYNDCEPSKRGWAYAVDRIAAKKPDLIVAGHGGVWREPIPLLEAKQRAWKQRIEEFDELNPRPNRELFFSPYVS